MEMPVEEIVAIYRKRWEIELLFKQIKQNFPLRYFYLSFSFLYTYNSCFSTLALAGRPLFLVIGLAFET